MDNNDKKNFINKLYLDPIENLNQKQVKPKGFRIKPERTKEDEKVMKSLPNVNPNHLMGSVIIQNWETSKNVPEDIGDLIHFPVIIDRKKYRYKDVVETEASLPSGQSKTDFSRAKIRKEGEMLVKSMIHGGDNMSTNANALTSPSYLPSESTALPNLTEPSEEKNFKTIPEKRLATSGNVISTEESKDIVSVSQPDILTIPKKGPKVKLIDFTTFNKHLYLRDNDFLYAKRVGGPVDFTLCTYQDINPRSKIVPSIISSQSSLGGNSGGGRKKLPSLGNKPKNVDYITISKNTVIHYQKGNASVYSIQEWIDNYDKYKQLMKISLFKNFRNAKLFDLWRRFYKKTKRQYYTEKLKKKFFFIDKNLLEGILDTRTLLKSMKNVNIFDLQQSSAVLLNQFNELHKSNLVAIDRKVETFRSKVKKILNDSCNKSYQEYKILKKITLDDNNKDEEDDKSKNNGSIVNKKKDDNAGSNIQNFIKDSIPYAQDATRKTHYKKLLRYIRVMDYVFNETKFDVINYSLSLLDKKFKRLYDCYVNKWVDQPFLITKIVCMGDKIYYHPPISKMTEAVFENFIQETIYCVIYKKNFIDPQEFPKYMSCFEEVFEVSVDQNSNLNNRLKETEAITNKFRSIKNSFDLCYQGLNEAVETLRPILENYIKNSKIKFDELQKTATPTELKDLLVEFHEKDKIIKQLKYFINIGVFQFQLEDLLDMISPAPKEWLDKLRKVIPNVLVAKVKSSCERLDKHLVKLSINPTDIENFIKLKKEVEECNKEKKLHEDTNNDIIDLQNIIDLNKEIKIQDYESKYLIELKDLSVRYDRKLDSASYFIDNNIQQFRLDLKNEIAKFDAQIKSMITDLNNEILNTYNENTFEAQGFLDENSVKIKKCLEKKEKYQQQEDDLELDETLKSNFENLDNLVYEQELKVNLWNSVKEFQDQSKEWEAEQVLSINLPAMKASIKKWQDLCQVALVDLDIPQVPMELKRRIDEYDQLVPILEAIQNPNISQVNSLLILLGELLRTETKLEDQFFTCEKVKNLPDIFQRIDEIKELNNRANEEKRLKDLIKQTKDNFYPRKMPIKNENYVKKDIDKEFEFVEENLRMLNKIYLNKYYGCIEKELDSLINDFTKYQKFLTFYVYYQKYYYLTYGVVYNSELGKENSSEQNKLKMDNYKKNFMKSIKECPNIQRFLEHSFDKVMNNILQMINAFEQNYKAITSYFDKKRKDIPRFYLLSNDDINELYQKKEGDKFQDEVKQKVIYKIYRWIKYIKVAEDGSSAQLRTIDNEECTLKSGKTITSLKETIEFLDTCLNKKLKDNFKTFKRAYDDYIKNKKKDNIDMIEELITNKENLAQGIFNCMLFYSMDSLEKSFSVPDEAFDKLFDLYNCIKDEKIVKFISMIKDPNIPPLKKRVLINIISLFNYTKTLIEILIREDVTTNTDYNFAKLINAKIENDTYNIHFLYYTIEYGYEYVGLQDNFLIVPESERMYIALSNAITYKRPFQIYGYDECGKRDLLKVFANICGKRINYVCANKNYSIASFKKIFYGNLKAGAWICIDKVENIQFDLLETLAIEIGEIFRVLQTGVEEYGEDKMAVNPNQFNIFLFRNLSFVKPFESSSIPKSIKNYFRHLAMPKIDISFYINQSLVNLSIEKNEEYTNKILYVFKYLNCKIKVFQQKNIQVVFINKILLALADNISKLEDSKLIEQFLRTLLMDTFSHIMTPGEKEEYRKFLNEIFDIKDYVEPAEEEDTETNEIIKKELVALNVTNENFQNQVKTLYYSLKSFKSFILVGPPLSGKTKLIGLVTKISEILNKLNEEKYQKILNVKIYPKSRNPDTLFADNKVERAYRTNNNFFYNMISLFDDFNDEMLQKLNEHYNYLLGFETPKEDEDLSPEKLKKIFTKEEDNYQVDDESDGIINQGQNRISKLEIIKLLVFDGQIDDTWIEYINNIYDKENFLDLANGDKINLNEGFKMFFETANLKNAPPSFVIRQNIVPCSYNIYGWDSILYTWIDTNKKVIENTVLKNYIRGLFENYYPKIQDFVENNRIKTITLSGNYIMRTLINIFDSIIPMFNFEDIKIGRRNFGVVPKIEIIKKCTLSIFIFSCAWTMNLLSNFVIKTKIEKLISDIFKADDLKGPIFDYYIDDNTHDFELWSNMLKNPYYSVNLGDKNQIFTYGKVFIHTNETIPYFWLCEKFIDMTIPFYFNGKASSGKSMLVNSLLNKKSDEDLDITKIKMIASHNTSQPEVEDFIFSNLCIIKRDLFGDKQLKETCLFVDDVNLNIQKDKYGTSELLEFLREITGNQYIYDTRNNEMRYIKKFNVCCCGNLTAYPQEDEFNRFLARYLLVTYVTTDDYYLNIFKPTLEFNFRKYIPNTSGITATQYIQASLKLNNMLKDSLQQEPNKLHCQININDVIKVIQAFHLFTFKGTSDYPEYLKKLFFYETSLLYESKFNKNEDLQMFRTKICEAYSNVFKQDKVTPEMIFDDKWGSPDSYVYCLDYNNFNEDNPDKKAEHCFLPNKSTLIDFIKERTNLFYTDRNMKDKTYIKLTEKNINTIIKMLRIFENNNPNLLLIGKELSGKKPLFDLATFISGMSVTEIDNSVNNEIIPPQTTQNPNNNNNQNNQAPITKSENFVNTVIIPFLVDATHKNKKSMLYIPSSVQADFVFEKINKLIDIREIPNNFIFINIKEYGEITEEETFERLEKNIGFCIDLIPKSETYMNLFTNYPSLVKNCSSLFLHSWKNQDMTSYLEMAIGKIEIANEIKTKLPQLFIDIYHYTSKIYESFYQKTGIQLFLDRGHFSQVCEFYSSKYNDYKNVLKEKQKKYNEGLEILNKVKEVIENSNKEIEASSPARAELDKKIEEIKKKEAEMTKEKNNWKNKKKDEEKIEEVLKKNKIEKTKALNTVIFPLEGEVQKVTAPLNKINANDLTEIKNTWDSFNFGKYMLQKVYEILGESNNEWENIKKTLDIKMIKAFTAITPMKNKDKLLAITKEITTNPEFSAGDNKYQKPFKFCSTLCDYFNGCNKYFNELDNQKGLIEEIEKLDQEIENHGKTIKEYTQQATAIDNQIGEIEKDKGVLDTKKQSINNHLIQLQAQADCFKEYTEVSSKKLYVWKSRKEIIDIILNNFEFYLMVMSSYIIYAAPLSKNHRLQYKAYLYSLAKELQLKGVKELEINKLFYEILDASGADNEFCSSIVRYSEFLADNFTMIYIMNNRIPYLIDGNRMSPDIISTFLELKTPKVIVKTTYNDINEYGDMYEKMEQAMKSGSILFIEQCEENIYNIIENLVKNKSKYNPEKGNYCYLIKNKYMEKNNKFKLYLIKSKNTSKIPEKAFAYCYVINFTCPTDIISETIYNNLCKEQNPAGYTQKNKIKNDINKDEFRLLDFEKKLLNYNKQFDLSGSLEKIIKNKELLDKYKIESSTHTNLTNQIRQNKKRIEIHNSELHRFEKISRDSAKLFKLCAKFFDYDNLYTFPIEYLSELVNSFYKEKFGLYKELIVKKTKQKKSDEDEEEVDEEPEEEVQAAEGNEGGNEGETKNEEEKEKEQIDKLLDIQLQKQKDLEEAYPYYKEDSGFDLVVFIYNKICQIYDNNKRRYVLLILLFYGLSLKEDIPENFKKIIYNVNRIYFHGQLLQGVNTFTSPIKNIDNKTWNCLKQINDPPSYIFSILLDHIETHQQEWEAFLDDDDALIERNFDVMDDDLASTLNPFTKFLFFSIVKTHLSDSLIKCTIEEIIQDQQVSFVDDNGQSKIKHYELEKQKTTEELFFENFNDTRMPILFFDKEDGEVMIQKEIKDFFMNKIKNVNIVDSGEKKEAVNTGEAVAFKEINPLKVEFTNPELDLIHNSMKAGGVICIRNCQLVKDSLLKVIEEVKDKSVALNENFKLLLFVNSKNLLPSYLYTCCKILNRDITILEQMKEYLLDLISSTPKDLFDKFMNCENNNSSAFYMKKLYIYFTVIFVILVQYSCIKSNIFKIPIGFERKDYFSLLNNLLKYMTNLPEERQKEMINNDNSFGFTYESLIKILSDIFINCRLMTKEDFDNVNDLLLLIYENSFFMKDELFFAYEEFILLAIDPKKYPVKNQQISIANEIDDDDDRPVTPREGMQPPVVKYEIPKSALLEEFEKIPNETYYVLLNGISRDMIREKTQFYGKEFYNIICKGNVLSPENKEGEEEEKDDIVLDKSVGKLNINTVKERLTDLKKWLPDSLNTTEANQALFKINKYNELFNPLDECLQVEIENYNTRLANLENDINCLLQVLKGDMALVSNYYEMIQNISNNKVPKEWQTSKLVKSVDLDEWMVKIKKIYDFHNKWISDGGENVYDLSLMSNEKLFLTVLPVYFYKKLPEGTTTSDKIKLSFKLTKYDSNEEITDEIMNEIKKNNDNKEFILIKGLRLKGFESHKEEKEKEIRSYKENEAHNIGELLPIVIITYQIEDYKNNEKKVDDEESDEEEEEEEEDIPIKELEATQEKKEEVQPAGSGPKDDENNNEEQQQGNEEAGNQGQEEEAGNQEAGNEGDNKEEDQKKEGEGEGEEDNEKVDSHNNGEEGENKDGEVKIPEGLREEGAKIVIEETTVEKKKLIMIEKRASIKEELMKETHIIGTKRTRIRLNKKHCKIDIPFIEEVDPRVYTINEPYGFIEIRFDCEKDKQEEYFINKKIAIVLDK